MRALAPLALAVSAVAATAGGCTSDPKPPSTLVDGSPAEAAPVRFEGVDGPTIVSKVRSVGVASVELGSPVAACLRDGWPEPPAGRAVHRIGSRGESVTFETKSGRSLQACDGIAPNPVKRGRWCGRAHGRLENGRLHDPRLDLACALPDGDRVAFLWVTPGVGARWIVVDHGDHAEAYEAARELPVRVATSQRIDLERSSISATVTEHSSEGLLLRRLELDAAVAG